MLLFYCGTTSGIQLARDLRLAHMIYRRRRGQWQQRAGSAAPFVLNWGCSPELLEGVASPTLNTDISTAISKLKAFDVCSAMNIPVPRYSTNYADLSDVRVLARRDGLSGGRGIEVVEPGQQPSGEYDFYVRYVPKAWEIRLHVFGNKIIHEQFKFVPQGSNVLIRNHDNGARFSSKVLESHVSPDIASKCRAVALGAMYAIGLYFGAVDLIVSHRGNVYFLEANTAPGLSVEGGTYAAYLEAIRGIL